MQLNWEYSYEIIYYLHFVMRFLEKKNDKQMISHNQVIFAENKIFIQCQRHIWYLHFLNVS